MAQHSRQISSGLQQQLNKVQLGAACSDISPMTNEKNAQQFDTIDFNAYA